MHGQNLMCDVRCPTCELVLCQVVQRISVVGVERRGFTQRSQRRGSGQTSLNRGGRGVRICHWSSSIHAASPACPASSASAPCSRTPSARPARSAAPASVSPLEPLSPPALEPFSSPARAKPPGTGGRPRALRAGDASASGDLRPRGTRGHEVSVASAEYGGR